MVWRVFWGFVFCFLTGKSLSEPIILASTNPQYDKKIIHWFTSSYMKTRNSEHVVYMNCFECQNKNKKQFMYKTCSDLVVFMYWIGKSMNILLSYCGLVDARIRASEKGLPVHNAKITFGVCCPLK